ncbi:MAG TPA: hypothetical protein VN033_03450 [Vulgatibacter sp.]|nr:hypothetical protein [Vulgatibacter sp.]
MRPLLRFSIVLLLLLAYGLEAGASQRHLHDPGERIDCPACSFQSSPGAPESDVVTDLHEDVVFLDPTLARRMDPPPPLEPADVSFGTSPPEA